MKVAAKMVVIVMMMSFVAVCAYAGDLDPTEGPTTGTMHTLTEIYDLVQDTNVKVTGAPVAKTGQTLCYNESGTVIPCADTGQDGDLQKGVAIPNPRFTINLNDADDSDGTVTDNLTGLIWLKDANAADTSGYDTDGAVTWENAFDFINKLNDGVYGTDSSGNCGQSDWRLPNLFELESLRNMVFYNPCISNTVGIGQWIAGDPFDNVQSSYYWSGTTYARNTGYAWDVSMFNGYVNFNNKTNTYYVWPVRGGND